MLYSSYSAVKICLEKNKRLYKRTLSNAFIAFSFYAIGSFLAGDGKLLNTFKILIETTFILSQLMWVFLTIYNLRVAGNNY